jgi:hypothetical protein
LPSFNDQVLDCRITALVWFQADMVVDRVAEPLLTSEVEFRCLYGTCQEETQSAPVHRQPDDKDGRKSS